MPASMTGETNKAEDVLNGAPIEEQEQVQDAASPEVRDEQASIIEDLERRIAAVTEENRIIMEEAQRGKADFYNYRTRVEKDRERDRVLAAERAIDVLLPVLDNLDRTLAAIEDKDTPLAKGVSMVQRQFYSALQTLGLSVIKAEGAFDPGLHDAMMVVEVEDEAQDGMIVEELHKGYMLGDRVLRASQVRVGKLKEKD